MKTEISRHPLVWRWTRRVPASQEDLWRERLVEAAATLAVHGRPGARTVRLEIYASRKSELQHFARELGGRLERINAEKIMAQASAPRRPVRITSDLAVMDIRGAWPTDRPKPAILLRIGEAMAFGTGEHATTATCLRLLHDEAIKLPAWWTALDIGSGSGILSIAAEKLGAANVTAFDNDDRAVRAALANVRHNRCRRITLTQGDVLRWRAGRTQHAVVMANVYSGILCQAAPQITRALASRGALILSGILRAEEKEVLDAFLEPSLTLQKSIRRGRWVTLLLRRRSD